MRTSLFVNLVKFQENLQSVKNLLASNTKILAVVKADGYGHGAVPVANFCVKAGIDYLGVATIEEAVELREAGISTPILILTEPIDDQNLSRVIYYDVSLTVYTDRFLSVVKTLAATYKKKVKVHLKVDTGMNRVGVDIDHLYSITKHIIKSKFLYFEGLMTHLSDADGSDRAYTDFQLENFNNAISILESKGIEILIKHVANSAGITNFRESHFDMVRPGIMLYRGIMELKTKVIFVKEVGQGCSIGYSQAYITQDTARIAVLSVGYADGYSRLLSNKGSVLIHGERCPIRGNVCMDMIMVEVSKKNPVIIGDDATLIGTENSESITCSDIALLTGTIDYEVMCSIGKRVPRIYIN